MISLTGPDVISMSRNVTDRVSWISFVLIIVSILTCEYTVLKVICSDFIEDIQREMMRLLLEI